MMSQRFFPRLRAYLCVTATVVLMAGFGLAAQTPVATPLPPSAQGSAGNADLLLDQGKRLFEAFQYDQAVPVLDRLIGSLTGGLAQRPDLLVQAYELRARSRFNLGDSAGTEQDFSALLLIKPDFKLAAGVSPRVSAVLESVRRLTIGQLSASMTPAGDVQIDGRPYTLQPDAQTIDLATGDHELIANRAGYRPVTQKFTVVAGQVVPLAVALERVAATLAVVSVPDGVDVTLDGAARGKTQRGAGEASAPLMLNDLAPGTHRLLLRRDCYKDLDRTITIEKPDDLQTGALRLTEAIASVKVQTTASGATVFVDGVSKGQAPAEFSVCEGVHAIEVKAPRGRFIDRREWKTGDSTSLSAELRSAFAIVAVKTLPTMPAYAFRASVERALASAKRVLIYLPDAKELDAALQGETIPAGWLSAGETADAPQVPREVRREIGRKLASKLDAQGVAAIAAGPDPYTVTLSLLAAGSGEPDVMTINIADPAAQTRSVELLGAPLPPIVGPSLETSVVDVAAVPGAVVVRAGGAAGLSAGDVIVGAAGAPVASVADLRAKVAAIRPPDLTLALDVKGADGVARKVTAPAKIIADTIPLRDRALLYNRALVELKEATASAATPVERSAAHLNLAIALMRLGNWDEAQTELKDAQFADGPGVSAGTVAYLNGLCLEAVGRTADAQAAFTKAAAAPLARLSAEGPLVAPLAQQKLQPRR